MSKYKINRFDWLYGWNPFCKNAIYERPLTDDGTSRLEFLISTSQFPWLGSEFLSPHRRWKSCNNVAPWILRWTPAQKFLAFYFSLGGNLDKNNVRSFFCHVNTAVLSVISTKLGSWQFLKCLSLRYIPKRHFLPYIYIENSMMTLNTYLLFDKIQF